MWLICIQFSQKVINRVCIYPVDQKFGQKQSRSLCFQDKNVLVFYAEIKDGWQMWRYNDFWKKLPVDSPDTLYVKYFVKIALAHSFSETNMFLQFKQKF